MWYRGSNCVWQRKFTTKKSTIRGRLAMYLYESIGETRLTRAGNQVSKVNAAMLLLLLFL